MMPITVDSNWGTFWVFVIAAAVGAFGGLLAQISARPRKNRKRSVSKLVVGILLGVGGAVAALAVFRPADDVLRGSETVREWDPFRLVGLALVSGFAGPQFLEALRDRLVALATAEQVKSTLVRVKEDASAAREQAKQDIRRRMADQVSSTVAPLVDQAAQEMPPGMVENLRRSGILPADFSTMLENAQVTQPRDERERATQLGNAANTVAAAAAVLLDEHFDRMARSIETAIKDVDKRASDIEEQ